MIPEEKGEDTDEQTLKIFREELGETVEKSDLHPTHRIGAFKEDKSKCRPIIVKFSRYNVGDKVFKNKKKLKGKGYSITESLTAMRMKKLTEARLLILSVGIFVSPSFLLICRRINRVFAEKILVIKLYLKDFVSTLLNFLGVRVCLRHTLLNGCFQDTANP